MNIYVSDMKELTRCMKALANERRLRIIEILEKQEPLMINDIADRIDLSLKSTSKHLQKLSECEFITRTQRSLEVWCRLNRKHPVLRAILNHITTSK